jgi:hypothetical protein
MQSGSLKKKWKLNTNLNRAVHFRQYVEVLPKSRTVLKPESNIEYVPSHECADSIILIAGPTGLTCCLLLKFTQPLLILPLQSSKEGSSRRNLNFKKKMFNVVPTT